MTQEFEEFEEEYGDVTSPDKHITLLYGAINDKQAAQAVSWILANNFLEKPPSELVLMINSPGGSAASAFAIIEAMRGSSIPIKTVGMGQICSAGLLIFMNGSKGRRIITPTCSIMSHQFSTAIGGPYHELVNSQKELDYTHKRILDTYKKCTGKSESYIMKHLLNPHDAWMSPEEAVMHKIADSISDTKKLF